MAEARESGVHFIAGGHYATETFGIRRLGELRGRADSASSTIRRGSEPDLSPQIAETCFAVRNNRYPQGYALQSDEEDVDTWRST